MKKNKKISMDELFDVLSFYADKENYETIAGMTHSAMDKGLKARKILKKLVKETLNATGIKHNL